jgi:hypothetical protein
MTTLPPSPVAMAPALIIWAPWANGLLGPSRPQALFDAFDGAGNEARTRDLNLGKVALYQLSYSRT